MRDGFLLDPQVTHLNHGSFGACPVPVFEEYQALQRELECGPTDFFTRKVARWFWGGEERPGRLAEARAALAAFVGARDGGPRLRSERDLRPERGHPLAAPRSPGTRSSRPRTSTARSRAHGSSSGRRSSSASRTRSWRGSGRERARSPSRTSRRRPRCSSRSRRSARRRARRACSRSSTARTRRDRFRSTSSRSARTSTRATATSGCALRRAPGFLWARPEHQSWIEPLVVSWGYRDDADFAERHGWAGTRDPAAYLTRSEGDRGARDLRSARAPARWPTRRSGAWESSAIRACPAIPRRSCAPSSCRRATPTSSGLGSTRSSGSRRPCTSGAGSGSSASRSGRTTTRRTSSGSCRR